MSQRSTEVFTLDAYCSIVQSSQVMWSTWVSISREMAKKMWCIYITEFYEAIRMIYCLQENGYNQRLSCEVDQVRLRKINVTFSPICGFLDFIKIQKSFSMTI